MSLSGREIAQALLDNIGGPDNVRDLNNLGTMLCFTLKNASLVREENIKRLSSITGIIEADNLYYIIPESGFNLRIYNELTQLIGLPKESRPKEGRPQEKPEKEGLFGRMRAVFRGRS